jgi:hypothetical protein
MAKILVLMLAIVIGLATEAGATFTAGRITVTTTATALYRAQLRGSSVLLCNRHTASVYLGGDATLTTANGFELAAGDCTTQRPFKGDRIWFIVAAATARVDYTEGQYREQ